MVNLKRIVFVLAFAFAPFAIPASAQQGFPQTINTGSATVTTTASQIVAARPGRQSVTIQNETAVAVRIGPAGVTAGTGYLLPATIGATFTTTSGAALYAITGSGTATVSYIESY